MGVVNVTPDSFFDGGFYSDAEKALSRALELLQEGADIIDIGGESTQPGSDPVSAAEEIRRVIPIVHSLRQKTDRLISVDTMKSEVAQAALDAGADIINDISGLRYDSRMPALTAQYRAGLILMHMKGTPKTMQANPFYEDVVAEVRSFLHERLHVALAHGILKERVIIDPGIGFGKRLEDNLTLLNKLPALEELGRPVLIGVSRKSFIGKILDLPPYDRLEGTIAASILGVVRGAAILRVHDVRAVKRAVLVAQAILAEEQPPHSPEGERPRYVH